MQRRLRVEQLDDVGDVRMRCRLQRAQHIELVLHRLHEVGLLGDLLLVERLHRHLALRRQVPRPRHLREGALCDWAHGLVAKGRERVGAAHGHAPILR